MSDRVVVIGSGPVGATVARRATEQGLPVTMIEQGPAVTDPAGSHLRNAEHLQATPDSYFDDIQPYFAFYDPDAPPEGMPGAQTSSVVGGQGVLWTNNCSRMVAGLETWPGIEEAEWDRLYEVAERYFDVTPGPERSVRQEMIRSGLMSGLSSSRSVVDQPLAGRYLDPGHIHYVATADILEAVDGRVERLHGCARSLIHDDGLISGVDVDGSHVEADEVVIAAGAFGTPLLLHRSGIRPHALGRWLTFHQVLIAQVILDEEIAPPSTEGDFPPRLMIPPTPARPWNIMVLRDTNPFPPTDPDLDVPEQRLVEIQAFCSIDVREENEMDMGRDPPRFHVPVRPEDEERAAACRTDVEGIIETLGRARSGCEPQWMDLGFAHVTGTCRMGDDPSAAVADLHGGVHGFSNLWLATVGLIPSRVAVNPTLTAAALAVRTADRLSGSHPSV